MECVLTLATLGQLRIFLSRNVKRKNKEKKFCMRDSPIPIQDKLLDIIKSKGGLPDNR